LIEKLNLDRDTEWKIGADGRPNGKHSETAVYLSSLSVGKEQYQSPSNVYPIALVQEAENREVYRKRLHAITKQMKALRQKGVKVHDKQHKVVYLYPSDLKTLWAVLNLGGVRDDCNCPFCPGSRCERLTKLHETWSRLIDSDPCFYSLLRWKISSFVSFMPAYELLMNSWKYSLHE